MGLNLKEIPPYLKVEFCVMLFRVLFKGFAPFGKQQ